MAPQPGVQSLAITTITELTIERLRLFYALHDLMALCDRVSGDAAGAARGGGWTAADVKRLAEIRDLAKQP